MAKYLFGADTVEAAHAIVREELQTQANAQADSEVLETLMDLLCKDNPYTAPQELIEFERDELLDNMMKQLAGRYMPKEEFFELTQMTAEDFDKVLLPTAERNLTIKEIIKSIAVQENIEATDDDRQVQIAEAAARFGVTFEQEKNAIPVEELDEPIIMQKVLEFILAHSEITLETE